MDGRFKRSMTFCTSSFTAITFGSPDNFDCSLVIAVVIIVVVIIVVIVVIVNVVNVVNTNSGDRSIEGLVLLKTFHVLDGIAGELPTATIKSCIFLTRK